MVVVSCLATNPHSFSSRWREPKPSQSTHVSKGQKLIAFAFPVHLPFPPFLLISSSSVSSVTLQRMPTQPTGSLSVPTVPEPPFTDLTTVSRSSPSPPVSSALLSLPSCSSEAPVSSVAQEPDVATRLTSPSAPPPPHTMTKEYQEQMTEYMRSQKMNPIVSIHRCIPPSSDLTDSPVSRPKDTRAREWSSKRKRREVVGHVDIRAAAAEAAAAKAAVEVVVVEDKPRRGGARRRKQSGQDRHSIAPMAIHKPPARFLSYPLSLFSPRFST